MIAEDVGVLVVGHGTRDFVGQAQMRNLACQTAGCLAPIRTDLGFLELAEPSIAAGVQALARQGVKRLIVAPVLLFRAGHADRDIPEAVQVAAAECGIEVLAQTPPLEHQPAVIELSRQRFDEAIRPDESAVGRVASNVGRVASNVGRVSSNVGRVSRPVRISLVMIARGSSSDTAAAAMEKFAALRVASTPVSDYRVGYVAVRQPNVQQSLDWLASTSSETLVVQPHLLFEGEVYHSLCAAVAERQARDGRDWRVCQPLGSSAENFEDDRLARVLADLVLWTAKAQL